MDYRKAVLIMSGLLFFLGDPGFFGLIFLVLLLSILVGLPMFLLQLFSGEKIKFFGLKPGEPIYDANRHT